MNWFKKILTPAPPPARATDAQKAIAYNELADKLRCSLLDSEERVMEIGKNFEIVKEFMKTLDAQEYDAYRYWVDYFEDAYIPKKRHYERKRLEEIEKEAIKDSFPRPEWDK